MPMQQRILRPVGERPTPKPGLTESVIAPSALRIKVIDGKETKVPRVPAFTIKAAFPLWWNGLCLAAGENFVDVAKFDQLPAKTRRAVRQHVLDGELSLKGYQSAKSELEEKLTKPVAETAEQKAAREQAQAEQEAERARREAAVAELGNLEDPEIEADDEQLENANVLD